MRPYRITPGRAGEPAASRTGSVAYRQPRVPAASRSGPAVRRDEAAQPRVVEGEWRQPGADVFAGPPGAAGVLAGSREAVAIEAHADLLRRRVREGVGREQADRARLALEQLGDQVDEPWVLGRVLERGEPDQPVDAVVIGRNHAGTSVHVARLALELVFPPRDRVAAPLEDQLVAHLADAPEGAIGVHEVEPVEGGVHDLARAQQIGHREEAQESYQTHERVDDPTPHPREPREYALVRRLRLDRVPRVLAPASRDEPQQQRVVEA